MRITTKITWDMNSGEVLEHDWFDYAGPIAELKHDSEKQKADAQIARDNKLQKQAFDYQKGLMDQVQGSLSKYLSGDVGFDPTQLALMKTQFMGQNANDFNQARSGVMSALASRGSGTGNMPVGGDYVRGLSGLYGQEAQNVTGGINNINLQNLQQALTNKFNTANVFSGNAATLNGPISTFGSGAANALNQRINIGMQPTFWSTLGNSFGGAFGAGVGKGLSGALFPTDSSSGGGSASGVDAGG